MLIDQSNLNTCLNHYNSKDLRSLTLNITKSINILSDETLISGLKSDKEKSVIKSTIQILNEFKIKTNTLKEIKIKDEKIQEATYHEIRNTIIQAIPQPSTPEACVKIILWLLLFSKKDYKLVQHNISERFINHIPRRIEAIANLKNLDYRYELLQINIQFWHERLVDQLGYIDCPEPKKLELTTWREFILKSEAECFPSVIEECSELIQTFHNAITPLSDRFDIIEQG